MSDFGFMHGRTIVIVFAVERNYGKYICGAYIRALCHILVGNQLLAKVAAAVRRKVFVWNYRRLDASVQW